MKKFLAIIGLFLLTGFTFLVFLIKTEIVVENITTFNDNIFQGMKKRGFLPKCFPKKIKNITTVWNIDTNEFYMKFNIQKDSFYDFNLCKRISPDKVQKVHKKTWIHRVGYPKFVMGLQKYINNKNITIYSTYTKNNHPFYILIDFKTKIGFAFSN